MKLEGNAQWILYLDAGHDSRSASILSVSAKPRTAHFEAFGQVSVRPTQCDILVVVDLPVYAT